MLDEDDRAELRREAHRAISESSVRGETAFWAIQTLEVLNDLDAVLGVPAVPLDVCGAEMEYQGKLLRCTLELNQRDASGELSFHLPLLHSDGITCWDD